MKRDIVISRLEKLSSHIKKNFGSAVEIDLKLDWNDKDMYVSIGSKSKNIKGSFN